jgi:uncharacterized repeat protein (TIGR03809 family)
MIDRPAFQKLGTIAQKWRELAERRRDYFTELYRTGRWKLYYEEHELLVRMRDVVTICERWAAIAPPHQPVSQQADEPALPVERDAA